MKKFIALLTGDKFLNLSADSMKIENDAITVLCAYISEKTEGRPGA